jgi:hypothetical protein
VFDSGLFTASAGRSYPLQHNLASTRLLIRLFYSTDSTGAALEEVLTDTSRGRGPALWSGAFVRAITDNTLTVEVGGLGLSKSAVNLRTGFLRVIAVALP